MPNESFDFLACRVAAHHFDDVPAFADEARRVLRGGGLLGVIDMISPSQETTSGFSEEEKAVARRVYNHLERILDPSHIRALTAGEWKTITANSRFYCLLVRLQESREMRSSCGGGNIQVESMMVAL